MDLYFDYFFPLSLGVPLSLTDVMDHPMLSSHWSTAPGIPGSHWSSRRHGGHTAA